MTSTDGPVLAQLLSSIDAFEAGRTEVPDLQAQLQTTVSLLERDGSTHARDIRAAESDLELIQHTTLLAEHRQRVLGGSSSWVSCSSRAESGRCPRRSPPQRNLHRPDVATLGRCTTHWGPSESCSRAGGVGVAAGRVST